MAVSIGNNIPSIRAQRELSRSSNALTSNFERLSSGLRINHASDDAAGLAISSSLTISSRIYAQGIRNLNDAISVLSISEGAFNEITGIGIRVKELAEQSANGVYSTKQREALDQEVQALLAEAGRITSTTSFNGVKLLDGSFRGVSIQAGFGSNERLSLDIGTISLSTAPSGDGTFGALTTLAAQNSYSLVTGDLNGDGKADLTVMAGTGGVVFISNGNGTFKAGVSYSAGGAQLAAIMTGDVNGDGKTDLMGGGNGKLAILLGNGNGTFFAPLTTSVGIGLIDVQSDGLDAGDFNGDGNLDVVTAVDYNLGGEGYILIGNGNGTFKAPSIITGGDYGTSVVAGDVNGDGKLDVIVDEGYSNRYADVYLGLGNGSFTPGSAYYLNGAMAEGLKLRDLNGDGKQDLLASSTGLSVLLGNGDGSFKALRIYATGANPAGFDIADVNGDGKYDVIVADSSGSGTLSLLLGNGDGTFKARTSIAVAVPASSPFSVGFGDFNGDGASDIASTGNAVNAVSVRMGSLTPGSSISILTQSSARSALDLVETSLTAISTELGRIGALQSRVQSAMNNLATLKENYLAANSRIIDVDVATETSQLVRNRILQEAGSAVLANANQQPALALQLLRI